MEHALPEWRIAGKSISVSNEVAARASQKTKISTGLWIYPWDSRFPLILIAPLLQKNIFYQNIPHVILTIILMYFLIIIIIFFPTESFYGIKL